MEKIKSRIVQAEGYVAAAGNVMKMEYTPERHTIALEFIQQAQERIGSVRMLLEKNENS